MSWQTLLDSLPRLSDNVWVQAAAVVFGSLFLALVARWLLGRLVPWLTRRTRTEVDDQLVALLRGPVFLSVVLIGIQLALLQLKLEPTYGDYLLRLLKTIAVVVWLVFFVRVVRLTLETLARHRRVSLVQPQTLPLFDTVAKVMIVGGAAYFLLLSWKVDISGWVTSAGIVGLAVGLAARDTLANLFAGIAILAEAPCKVGDTIVLEGGERGEVTWIGIRTSRILTRDDVEIVVPNSNLANSKIINEAGGPWRKHRVRVAVGVAYGSDVDRVREVLLGAATDHPEVCAEPEPRVRFRSFGDSGLDFELLAWIDEPGQRGQILDALHTAVYKRFAAAGIEIPYPKRDVYVREWPGPPPGPR